MSRVAGAIVHKIAVSIAGKPATLIVARDQQTARAAIFLNAPLPIAIELSPEAHADLLQALSFPPCPGVANAKPERITHHASLPNSRHPQPNQK